MTHEITFSLIAFYFAEGRETIFALLKELRGRYTDAFNQVVTNDAEAAAFAASCQW